MTHAIVAEEIRQLEGQPDLNSTPYLNGQPDTRPTLSQAKLQEQYPGYFPGSVNGEIDRWKRRALAAEKRVLELEEEIKRCVKR